MNFFPGQVELDLADENLSENLSKITKLQKPGWEAIYALAADGDDHVYIGRTSKPPVKRLKKHIFTSVSGLVDRWKKSLKDKGLRLKMYALVCCPSESAMDVEDCFIERFKQIYGERCLNTLRGNAPWSEKVRMAVGEAISKARRGCPGRPQSEATREKIKAHSARYRHDISTAQIAQMYEGGQSIRQTAKALNISPGLVRERLRSAAVKMRPAAHPISEETRKKIGKALQGRLISEQARMKMSEARRGRPRGPLREETKLKISLSHRRNHAERRLVEIGAPS